jgi:hypothetical protein
MATTTSAILSKLGVSKEAVFRSLQWFRGVVSSMRKSPPEEKKTEQRSPFQLTAVRYGGPPIVSSYDKLPYFDQFPLILPLGETHGAGGGTITRGLNVHYLVGKNRSAFFNMLRRAQDPTTSAAMKGRLLQGMIQLAKSTRPIAFRSYANKYIGNYRRIPVSETMQAADLYVARFRRNAL